MADAIDALILREGPPSHDPADKGGRTEFGISETANPEAWADGQVTHEEARAIYIAKYLKGPGFDAIPFTPLQVQLVDFGVTSGPMVAIQKLQGIVGVAVDGHLGPATLAALSTLDPKVVNNDLVKARVLMIAGIVAKNPSQLKFLVGWTARALEFLL